MPALRPFLTCDKCLTGTALEATNPSYVNYLKILYATKNQRNIVFTKKDIFKILVIPRNNIA